MLHPWLVHGGEREMKPLPVPLRLVGENDMVIRGPMDVRT